MSKLWLKMFELANFTKLSLFISNVVGQHQNIVSITVIHNESIDNLTFVFPASRYQAQQPPPYSPPQGPVYPAPPPMYTPQYGNYNWVPVNTFPNAPPGMYRKLKCLLFVKENISE